MAKSKRVPVAIWIAATVVLLGQMALAVSHFDAFSVLWFGVVVMAVWLLLVGSAWGWGLTVVWALSSLIAPFVFDDPFWIGVAGVAVLIAMVTRESRAYCLEASAHPEHSKSAIAAERDGLGRVLAVCSELAGAAVTGTLWSEVVRRMPFARLSKKRCLVFFLVATAALLPAVGALQKMQRGSGRGDVLVNIAFHLASVLALFAEVGLVVTVIVILRAALRRSSRGRVV